MQLLQLDLDLLLRELGPPLLDLVRHPQRQQQQQRESGPTKALEREQSEAKAGRAKKRRRRVKVNQSTRRVRLGAA